MDAHAVNNNNNSSNLNASISTSRGAANSSTSSSLLAKGNTIIESDSDGEFPASVQGSSEYGSGSEGEGGGDNSRNSDADSVDSTDYFDAVARKPITRVRMGESKRVSINMHSSNMSTTSANNSVLLSSSIPNLNRSTYG